MFHDPNQPQQYPYAQPPQPYSQPPYASPPYAVPPLPNNTLQQPPRKRRLGLWIVLGIIGVLLLACVGGSFALINFVTHSPATQAVNQYYAAIKSQDYATAYTYLDASGITFNNQPLVQTLYSQVAQALDARKGKVSDASITNTNISSSNGVNTASCTVSVTRNGQSYDVHLQLKQEGNDWKIVSIDNI